jgi:hypothetical protein
MGLASRGLDCMTRHATPEAACAQAEALTNAAEKLIADTGYRRRDGELADLTGRAA